MDILNLSVSQPISPILRTRDRNARHARTGESRHWCMYHGVQHSKVGNESWVEIGDKGWGKTAFSNGRQYYGPCLVPTAEWKEGYICSIADLHSRETAVNIKELREENIIPFQEPVSVQMLVNILRRLTVMKKKADSQTVSTSIPESKETDNTPGISAPSCSFTFRMPNNKRAADIYPSGTPDLKKNNQILQLKFSNITTPTFKENKKLRKKSKLKKIEKIIETDDQENHSTDLQVEAPHDDLQYRKAGVSENSLTVPNRTIAQPRQHHRLILPKVDLEHDFPMLNSVYKKQLNIMGKLFDNALPEMYHSFLLYLLTIIKRPEALQITMKDVSNGLTNMDGHEIFYKTRLADCQTVIHQITKTISNLSLHSSLSEDSTRIIEKSVFGERLSAHDYINTIKNVHPHVWDIVSTLFPKLKLKSNEVMCRYIIDLAVKWQTQQRTQIIMERSVLLKLSHTSERALHYLSMAGEIHAPSTTRKEINLLAKHNFERVVEQLKKMDNYILMLLSDNYNPLWFER